MKIKGLFSGLGKRQAIEKAKSTVLTTVVIASIVVSFAVVTINFLWNLRDYNTQVLGQKQEARDTLEENVANAEELKTQFEIFEQGDIKSQDVLDALPSKYDFAAIITSIDALAKRSGMALDGFIGVDESEEAVQTAVEPEPIEIPFTVTVVGRYDDLEKFVDNLDRSIRPMRIDSIIIGGNDNNIEAEIAITTYYQPQADVGVEYEEVQ